MIYSNVQELAKNTTALQLVSAWQQSKQDITTAWAALERAESRMADTFGVGRYQSTLYMMQANGNSDTCDGMIKRALTFAWKRIIERIEIRRVMSVAAEKELDKWLESGELPDLTETALMQMLEMAFSQSKEYLKEAVAEVFEFLRPHRSKLKTNTEYEVPLKVIMVGWVECNQWSKKFSERYHCMKEIKALDKVFHSLDAKGMPAEYNGSLLNAINSSGTSGLGETDYFRFKCCKNGNLHLEFKRPDLVAELNQIAGGKRLRP